MLGSQGNMNKCFFWFFFIIRGQRNDRADLGKILNQTYIKTTDTLVIFIMFSLLEFNRDS